MTQNNEKENIGFIAIGNELLHGSTIDTNGLFIGNKLNKSGYETKEIRLINDNIHDIIKTITDLSHYCRIIIISGGLGPTHDDITRQALAQWGNSQLIAVNKDEKDSNNKEIMIPKGSSPIINNIGSAFGIDWLHEKAHIICLPGVPKEFESMVTHYVLPTHFEKKATNHYIITLFGIRERHLADTLQDDPLIPRFIPWGTQFSPEGLRIWLKIPVENQKRWWEIIKEGFLQKLRPFIVSFDETTVYQILKKQCIENNLSIATAESLTGGLLGVRLTEHQGSSQFFRGGIMAYTNVAKNNILSIPDTLLKTDGPISAPTARLMAQAAREMFDADIGISTTGMANRPEDRAEDRTPAGHVFIGLSHRKDGQTNAYEYNFKGDRETIRRYAAAHGAWCASKSIRAQQDLSI